MPCTSSDGSEPGKYGLDARSVELVSSIVVEQLRKAQLLLPSRIGADSPDLEATRNEDFWIRLLEQASQDVRWVKLQDFQIVDWYPRSPGLYHTGMARYHREKAEGFWVEDGNESYFSPPGKGNMIQGGIGSLRFKPIELDGEDHWMCTATSDEYCHTGIPLAISESLLARHDIRSRRFVVSAQVRFVPDFFEHHFEHFRGVPQVFLQAHELRELGPVDDDVRITPTIYFRSDRENVRWDSPGGNQVSFVTCYANRLDEIEEATDWLGRYAHRYGGEVITNFDQQRPTFEHAPFSLQNVMNRRFALDQISHLHVENADIVCESIERLSSEFTKMTKITVTLGDGTVVHGSLVVANSIKDSFNAASSHAGNDELKELLQELTRETAKMIEGLDESIAEEVSRDLQALVQEATVKKPRERWWKLSADGLSEAAKTVGTIGKVVLDLLKRLPELLG